MASFVGQPNCLIRFGGARLVGLCIKLLVSWKAILNCCFSTCFWSVAILTHTYSDWFCLSTNCWKTTQMGHVDSSYTQQSQDKSLYPQCIWESSSFPASLDGPLQSENWLCPSLLLHIKSQPYLDYFQNTYPKMKNKHQISNVHTKWNCLMPILSG